jgi:hypothetical protein
MAAGLTAMLLLSAATLAIAPSASASTSVPFQRAITVGEWGRTAFEPAATRRLFHRLERRHVDTVTLFVVWMQDGADSTSVKPGEKTARTKSVVRAIRAARSVGIKVVLRPYIDRLDNGWRGEIHPRSLEAWFSSYSRFVLDWARIAQREHALGFVIGSEMASLSGEAGLWSELARRVRQRFRGFITYQANWDEAEKVTWWDAVDAISISAYYPLTTKLDDTTEDLVRGWRVGGKASWFERIAALARRVRRPVLFGEIGYRTVSGTAMRPWDAGPIGRRSTLAQVRAYEAALRVWYRVPWFRGFQWWYLAPQRKLVAGLPGADHQPARATLELLGRWYARRR